MSQERQIKLYGRIVLTGRIHALSGLHIGASKDALEIGGVDMPVIRNPVDRRPYIPGSSLKGKMRSQWAKLRGVKFETRLKDDRDPAKRVFIHTCGDFDCPVCAIYGTTGDKMKQAPTRLTVRDVLLDADSLPNSIIDHTEVKWEAAIDRVTSAAGPRQTERVPAGAVFGTAEQPMELVYSVYTAADQDRFAHVLTALQLVQDDFLGGQGSRGSGKVAFKNLTLMLKSGETYQEHSDDRFEQKTLADLLAAQDDIERWIKDCIPTDGGA